MGCKFIPRKGGEQVAAYKELEAQIVRSGLTHEQIAEKLNVHVQTLYNKRNGKSDFTVKEALKLKEILGINQTELSKVFFG